MRRRPQVLEGTTEKLITNCGNMFVTINDHKEELYEVRLSLGKSGSCVNGLLNIIGILLSRELHKEGTPKEKIKFIKDLLQGFSCNEPFKYQEERFGSCMDWIAHRCIEELEKCDEKEEESKS